MKRGEVLMKPEDARRKKAPKGYNYEPVLPGAQIEPQVPADGKRVRRATSKVPHLPQPCQRHNSRSGGSEVCP